MKKTTLMKIFLRSFFIHTTLNFRRMQNLGFAMAIIPLIREWRLEQKDSEKIMTRHVQMFNTHPYFSAPVIGSVVRLEEEQAGKGEALDVIAIKQSLMASYAAIGDIFFWGALRPFASIIAVMSACMGLIVAPVIFLLVYTPVHLWIRLKGFIEGYRGGKKGFEFIRSMDLPGVAVKIRWLSLFILAGSVIWLSCGYWPFVNTFSVIVKLTALAVVLICLILIKKGISQVYIIYSAVVIFILISWTGFIN
ncbi:MAG: PTS system mannose/fructose/sorbose family transporter subunit IID [Deltaproteobacteria bacterium]|nr:PTS system mannose/fructose/sorbose family transporter subunit IID [Deltaproteobacteria bacterium]